MYLNERGALNSLLIPLILATLCFFGALGFGVWAYASQQDYKNNSDKKSAVAVAIAVDRTKSSKDNEFIQREKEPLRDYQGQATLGSVAFKYPKTWSVYSKDSSNELSLTLHPSVVSGNQKSVYALRVEVVNQPYSQLVSAQDGSVRSGKLSAVPYALPKLPALVGIRFDGQLTSEKKGAMVLLPLRDKTLRISTESQEFVGDFTNIILANLTFSP